MPCQGFPRKRGYARLFFVAALLAWLVPFFVAGWTGRSWEPERKSPVSSVSSVAWVS